MDIIIWCKVIPVQGSGRSKIRFVANSHVLLVPNLEESAAWHATRDAYFPLLEKEIKDWKGGTNLIFVPSGKLFSEEP
jgi:hypothetical protein